MACILLCLYNIPNITENLKDNKYMKGFINKQSYIYLRNNFVLIDLYAVFNSTTLV